MAKLSSQNAFASESADSFGGIDRTGYTGKLSEAYDMTNLRILSDGSLARREGYTCLACLPAPVDAAAVSPSDPTLLYAIAEGILYTVSLEDGGVSPIEQLPDPSATMSFFTLPGKLYLVCGGIWSVTPRGLIPVDGYAPLIGKGWGAEGGEPYEPLNLLSRRVRINYTMDVLTSRIYTGLEAESVDAVYSDGYLYEGAYPDGKYVQLPCVFDESIEVQLYLTLSDSEFPEAALLRSCRGSYSCGRGNDAVTALFGAEDGSRMFRIHRAAAEPASDYYSVYPDADSVYCPADQAPLLDMAGGIRAICGEPDCLLAFGKYETRRVYPDGELSVPGAGGCESQSSAVYFNGTAYIASENGIRRLPLRSGNGEIISYPLDDLLSPESAARAVLYYDHNRSELIVSDGEDGVGTAFIHNTDRDCWYKFEGIGAQGFFANTSGGGLGFWADAGIFRFSPDLSFDTPLDGIVYPIPLYYRSLWSALGKHEDAKRLRRMRVALSGGGTVNVTLSDPLGVICSQEFTAEDGEQLSLFDRPIRSGRAIHMRLILTSEDNAPTRIHGFALSAIK